MKQVGRLGAVLLGALMLMPSQVLAEDNNFYVGLDAHHLINKVGNAVNGQAEFKPKALGIRAGVYIEPQLGVEVFGMFSVDDDKDIGIEMNMNSSAGVLGRFETPEAEGGKLFLLLGYGMSELELKRSSTSLADKELYHGFIYGGGLEFRLAETNNFLSIQGMRHYHKDDITLDALSLAYRYQF